MPITRPVTTIIEARRKGHIELTKLQQDRLTALQLCINSAKGDEESKDTFSNFLLFQMSLCSNESRANQGRGFDEANEIGEIMKQLGETDEFASLRGLAATAAFARILSASVSAFAFAAPSLAARSHAARSLSADAAPAMLADDIMRVKKLTPAAVNKITRKLASRMHEETYKELMVRCQSNRSYARESIYEVIVTAVAQKLYLVAKKSKESEQLALEEPSPAQS